MSGVIDDNGVQWERCTQCAEFHRLGEECDKTPEQAAFLMKVANRVLAHRELQRTGYWPFWWDNDKNIVRDNAEELFK